MFLYRETCHSFSLSYRKILLKKGCAVAQLVEALRYIWKVAGSIPDGVIGIFH